MHWTTWQARTSGCTENRKTSFLITSEQSWLSKVFPIVLLNFSSHHTAVKRRLLCCCKWTKIKSVLGITSFPIKSRLPIYHQHFRLFCSIQALLCHCRSFYHESPKKQGSPLALIERDWGLSASGYLPPNCSRHEWSQKGHCRELAWSTEASEVLDWCSSHSKKERMQASVSTWDETQTLIYLDVAKFNWCTNSRATTSTGTKWIIE